MITNIHSLSKAATLHETGSLLPIGHTENKLPFEIHTLEWIEKNRWPQNAAPHRHNHFEIIWVQQGSGIHLIDLEKYEIGDNNIYCITPGQVHLFKANEGSHGYLISFSTEFLCLAEDNFDLLFNTGLFYTFSQTPVIHLTKAMKDEMDEIAEKMMKEFDNYFLLRAEILRGFLKIFLIYLTRQFEKSSQHADQSRNTGLVKKFIALLDKNFTSKKMVADYANELCVTPNYLNEIVKKITGFPASEHIKNRIILEAKRQASYTHASMKEIAYNLGFNDTSHFSKFFKNACGINFTNFKNELEFS